MAGQVASPTSASPPGSSPAASRAPAPVPASAAPATGTTAAAKPGVDGQPGAVTAAQALEVLSKGLGNDWGAPIVTPAGVVYVPQAQPERRNGQAVIRLVKAGVIDRAKDRFRADEAFIARLKKHEETPRGELVEVQGKHFLQTLAKGEDGTLKATLVPATEEDIARHAEAQKAKAAQAQLQGTAEWYQKSAQAGSLARLIGFGGSFVTNLANGPDPMTGRHTGAIRSGFYVLRMLDSQAQGKLLPEWMRTGPVATAVDWAMELHETLFAAHHVKVLVDAFPAFGEFISMATAPVRAVGRGVANLLGLASGSAAATGAVEGAARAAGAAGAAAGASGGLASIGREILSGKLTPVAGVSVLRDAAGAVHTVPTAAMHGAVEAARAGAASGAAGSAMQLGSKVSSTAGKLFSTLAPLLRPIQTIGSLLTVVAGALRMKLTVEQQGAQALVTTKDGRGALTAALNGAAMVGQMSLPLLASGGLLGAASVPVASSVLGLAVTGLSISSLLNYSGFFGGDGFLDSDVLRAIALIPPFTPLGVLGFAAKLHEKRKLEEAKKDAELVQAAGEQVRAVLNAASADLAAGKPVRVMQDSDGSLLLPTGIDESILDIEQKARDSQGTAADRTLQMMSRMRVR